MTSRGNIVAKDLVAAS